MKKITLFSTLNCRSFSLLVMTFIFSMSFAQNSYTIQFQDEIIEVPENINTFQWNQLPDYSELNNGYVGWVQFYETPDQNIQNRFKNNNLQLLEYIPNRTYLFYFPNNTSITFLKDNGVRAIIPVEGRFKVSSELNNPPFENWAMDGNNILVILQHHKNVSTEFVINDLARKQIAVWQQYNGSNNIELSIPNNCLEELSNLPYVKWVELITPPSIPEDTRGRTLHRANGLDTQTGAGRNYTGVGIGLMLRDDGIIGPHIDFQGRVTNYVGNNSGSHGDFVTGVMAGAGNLNPSNRGMAVGSDIHIVNYNSSFLDSNTVTLINDGTVQITNSSYGNGCNSGYTTTSQNVDTQCHTIQTIIHVFSCGNSGPQNCGYGAGSGWGNITGGHKQGKNVIATASTNFVGSLSGFSSRGPASDGRIKPDITAMGEGVTSTSPNNGYSTGSGTSFSSPGIAGVAAQLYQVYADANGGILPQSALIKAALLNTARDAGNVGPDFKFGWGIVNGLRAGILIEDGRFLMDNVSQGNSNTHTINVPAGTTQVRFMVYWNDPAATAGANPALVNDLDLLVTDPSTTVHEPWILDSTPDPVLLNLPATQGPDHLNNMEQVLINSPASGNYNIEITGFNVPVGPQEYFVVYEIIAEELTVIFPNAGESFFPNLSQTIHWDAINTTQDFVLEYSTNNGVSWSPITTVNNNVYTYSWSVPNEITGEALVRITSGAFQDESDAVFNIASFPNVYNIIEVCPTTATFDWVSIADAESYDFYLLGDKYMELEANTTNTTITIPITDPNDEIWFAIAARNDTEGWVSNRNNAKRHAGGLLNCVLAVDNNTLEEAVSIYPNPASDEVFININNINAEAFEVIVTNSLGQTLYGSKDIAFNGTINTSIDVSNYTTGLYFVTIKVGQASLTKKMIVK